MAWQQRVNFTLNPMRHETSEEESQTPAHRNFLNVFPSYANMLNLIRGRFRTNAEQQWAGGEQLVKEPDVRQYMYG